MLTPHASGWPLAVACAAPAFQRLAAWSFADAVCGTRTSNQIDGWKTSTLLHMPPGFDAHKKDEINFRYIGVTERDYEWLTEQLVAVANR